MPDTAEQIKGSSREALERAFQLFQAQCEMLEKSHAELTAKLAAAQLDLQEKNAELAHRMRETELIRERLADVLGSINDAVFIVAPDLAEIECANAAARDLRRRLTDAGISLDRIEPAAKLIGAGVKVNDQNLSFRLNGENVYWMVSIIPMQENSGLEVLSIKDITAQRNLEVRLAREDRLASLGRVAASVAHEIRNPLAAIEGFAALLTRDLKEQPAQLRLAEKTVYAARQLNAVVGNLLGFTREMTLRKAPCELNRIMYETLAQVAPMAEDQRVEINARLAPGLPTVPADQVMLRQAFVNIVTNAVEACPHRNGGRIDITTEFEDGSIRIRICDNGPGIPQDRKKRIFEPFFTMKEGGVGLGLALCQRIIESHDGMIEECGRPGEGAQFVIELSTSEVLT